ncbi:MAG: DUF4440 domain-containing protein [Pseudomonadota bacterium]
MRNEGADQQLFRSLEQQLLEPAVRSSRTLVSDLLADDFIEFGSSGRVYDKSVTVDALALESDQETSYRLEVSDFSARPLSEDTVLVTYRCLRQETKSSNPRNTLRSSIWQRIDGRWQMSFHQGTIIPAA